MLDEFWEFDKRVIHEKYKAVVEEANIVAPTSHNFPVIERDLKEPDENSKSQITNQKS